MACLLCVPSSLPLASITKTNSRLNFQPKANSLVSVPSAHSQARDESKKSSLPVFSISHQPRTQLSSRTSKTTARASSGSETSIGTEWDQTVEHIVFLQVKEVTGKPWDLKDALNSLKCLPGTLYLSAGYVGETYGAPGRFNYFLHSRLATKNHRDRFMQHPLKYGFSMGYTEGLCDDFMMLDYIYTHKEPLRHPVHGCALRFVFLKLKDRLGESSLQGVFEKVFPLGLPYPQVTFGHIIEPCFTVPGTKADAVKGYKFAWHAEFDSKEALDATGSPKAFAERLKNRLGKELVDDEKSIFIHDYMIDEVYTCPFVEDVISGF